MKAIRFHETGVPEVLRLEELPLPEPGPGQARVRHTAIGVTFFIDTYHRTGLYKLPLPSGLGVEAAGVVEAVGQDVATSRPATGWPTWRARQARTRRPRPCPPTAWCASPRASPTRWPRPPC